MEHFWKFISYLFHPFFAPFSGVVAYYLIAPHYNTTEIEEMVMLVTLIMTIFIPVIFLFLLKAVGWIQSVYLEEVSDRKIPLYIGIVLIYIMIRTVITHTLCDALYYYFIGILGTLLVSLVLVYFKYKASIHIMGITGYTVFILGLSLHYEIDLTLLLAALTLCIGLVGSSRLYLNVHDNKELWIGFFAGIIPQFTTFSYWL